MLIYSKEIYSQNLNRPTAAACVSKKQNRLKVSDSKDVIIGRQSEAILLNRFIDWSINKDKAIITSFKEFPAIPGNTIRNQSNNIIILQLTRFPHKGICVYCQ